jgi:hypothetical protein
MRRAATLLVLLGLSVPAPLAIAASTTATESYGALIHQIDARQVAIAHVNEETRHISVTLVSGAVEFVIFTAAQDKTLIDALIHHGVKPIYTSHTPRAKPVHHVLRYIAAGVVVVLLLIGGGVWVYTRGQRQPPAAAATDSSRGRPARRTLRPRSPLRPPVRFAHRAPRGLRGHPARRAFTTDSCTRAFALHQRPPYLSFSMRGGRQPPHEPAMRLRGIICE